MVTNILFRQSRTSLRILGREFKRGFTNSGASTKPGFLMEEHIEKLRRTPRPFPEPLREILPASNEFSRHFRPNLTNVRTIEEAHSAVSQYINQEPLLVTKMLRIASRSLANSIEHLSLGQIARTIFAEALEEMHEEGGCNNEGIDKDDAFLLDSPTIINEGDETGALNDHIQCSRVLKKRPFFGSGFGQANQQQQQQQQQQQRPPFGSTLQPPASNNPFGGAPSSTGPNQSQQPTTFTFGQPPSTYGSAFGQPTNFGGSVQTPSAFGAPSGFGTQVSTTTSGFGATRPITSTFGSSTTTTTPFGSASGGSTGFPASNVSTFGSGFGVSQPSNLSFGGTSSTGTGTAAFGAPATGFSFGAQPPTAASIAATSATPTTSGFGANGFGGFGTTTMASGSSNLAAPPQPASTSFFGTKPGAFTFGNSVATPAIPTFGAQSNVAPTTGNAATISSGFGSGLVPSTLPTTTLPPANTISFGSTTNPTASTLGSATTTGSNLPSFRVPSGPSLSATNTVNPSLGNAPVSSATQQSTMGLPSASTTTTLVSNAPAAPSSLQQPTTSQPATAIGATGQVTHSSLGTAASAVADTTASGAEAPKSSGFTFTLPSTSTSITATSSTNSAQNPEAKSMFSFGSQSVKLDGVKTEKKEGEENKLVGAAFKSTEPKPTETLKTTKPAGAVNIPTSNSAQPSETTLPTKSLPLAVSFPSTLKNKSLEEIILSWNEELENLVSSFEKQAVEIAQWDKKIIHNGEQIIALNDRVNKLEAFQKEVDQSLSYVVTQQSELEGLLNGMEKELPGLAHAVIGEKPSTVDTERDRIYESAESVQKQVIDIANSLSRMIFEINSAPNEPLVPDGTSSQPLVDVAQILNAHLDALQWIDHKVEELRKATTAVNAQALKASNEMERLSGKSSNDL